MESADSADLAVGPVHEGAANERTRGWIAGWVLSALVTLFLLFDGAARVVEMEPYVEGLATLGYRTDLGPAIGVTLIVCAVLYALPRTAVLGAVLVTGYLGGAMASQVRIEEPNALFALGMGVVAWAALCLREPRVWGFLLGGETR